MTSLSLTQIMVLKLMPVLSMIKGTCALIAFILFATNIPTLHVHKLLPQLMNNISKEQSAEVYRFYECQQHTYSLSYMHTQICVGK